MSTSFREYLSLDELELWEGNPHIGDVDAIARSIQAFGFNEAVKVRGVTVYAGNQSIKALRQLRDSGAALPIGLIADPSGGWIVPVIKIDHLDAAHAEAFGLAHNQIARLGRDDEKRVAAILASIGELSDATGYTDSQINALLQIREPEQAPTSFPRIDDVETNTTCPKCGYEWSKSR